VLGKVGFNTSSCMKTLGLGVPYSQSFFIGCVVGE
jgi:hypothetical protein